MPCSSAHKCPSCSLSHPLQLCVLRFLLLGWALHAIAADCHVGTQTVYLMASNLLHHESVKSLSFCTLRCPRRLTIANEDAVLEMLLVKR